MQIQVQVTQEGPNLPPPPPCSLQSKQVRQLLAKPHLWGLRMKLAAVEAVLHKCGRPIVNTCALVKPLGEGQDGHSDNPSHADLTSVIRIAAGECADLLLAPVAVKSGAEHQKLGSQLPRWARVSMGLGSSVHVGSRAAIGKVAIEAEDLRGQEQHLMRLAHAVDKCKARQEISIVIDAKPSTPGNTTTPAKFAQMVQEKEHELLQEQAAAGRVAQGSALEAVQAELTARGQGSASWEQQAMEQQFRLTEGVSFKGACKESSPYSVKQSIRGTYRGEQCSISGMGSIASSLHACQPASLPSLPSLPSLTASLLHAPTGTANTPKQQAARKEFGESCSISGMGSIKAGMHQLARTPHQLAPKARCNAPTVPHAGIAPTS